MVYAEMYKVTNKGVFCGYLICTEGGNYLYESKDNKYSQLCLGCVDILQITESYQSIKFLSSDIIECVKYYNIVRNEVKWSQY